MFELAAHPKQLNSALLKCSFPIDPKTKTLFKVAGGKIGLPAFSHSVSQVFSQPITFSALEYPFSADLKTATLFEFAAHHKQSDFPPPSFRSLGDH